MSSIFAFIFSLKGVPNKGRLYVEYLLVAGDIALK